MDNGYHQCSVFGGSVYRYWFCYVCAGRRTRGRGPPPRTHMLFGHHLDLELESAHPRDNNQIEMYGN